MSTATRTRTNAPETIRFNIQRGWNARLSEVTGVEPEMPAWANVNRYTFDFGLGRDWAQMDTSDDASYYGHWTSPTDRAILSYVEGDVEYRSFATEQSYVDALRAWIKWARDFGIFKGIDGMLREDLIAEFKRLGLGKELH